MNVTNFDKLYTDFKNLFDLCRYTDADLKAEIIKRATTDDAEQGSLLFRFRLVVFKFDVSGDTISYLGYEK